MNREGGGGQDIRPLYRDKALSTLSAYFRFFFWEVLWAIPWWIPAGIWLLQQLSNAVWPLGPETQLQSFYPGE